MAARRGMLPLKALLVAIASHIGATALASPLTQAVDYAHAIRRVPDNEPGWGAIPPRVVQLLPLLKHALRDDALAALTVSEPLEKTEEKLLDAWSRRGLLATAADEGSADEEDESDWDYSHVESLKLEKVSTHPNLIALRITLAIPYGDDTSLYLVDRKNNAVVWTWEKNGYEGISEAGWSLDYHVTPKATDGRWYVVIAHLTPWPSSSMRGIRLEVHEPSQGRVTEPLRRFEDSTYIGGDPFELSGRGDRFGISYDARTPIDGEIIRRSVWWRIDRGRFERIPPVGTNAVAFVEYWLESEWKEANRFAGQSARAALRRMHGVMHPHAPKSVSVAMEPGCELPKGRSVVAVGTETEGEDEGFSALLVVADTPAFRIEGIRSSREGLCNDRE